MRPLDILITSGGTICKIDDVRHIGNFSSGTTGAIIAEEFLRRGNNVHYFHSQNAKQPFRRNMILNSLRDFEEESTRLRDVYLDFTKYRDFLKEYSFLTFQDYYDLLKRVITGEPISVVILAAAVSDYLSRNPKVISLIKKWNPDVFQVGFKLLTNVGLLELIETAYDHGQKNNSDLTVANSINRKDFMRSQTAIITPEREVFCVKRYELARKLYETIAGRVRR